MYAHAGTCRHISMSLHACTYISTCTCTYTMIQVQVHVHARNDHF